MYADDSARDVNTLERRERLAQGAIYAVIGVYSLTATGQSLDLGGVINMADTSAEPLALIYKAVIAANLAVFPLSVIAVAMWIHRAHANLWNVGIAHLEFTPGWAIGWYFIPIATYFKPYQAMRELWQQSHLGDGSNPTDGPTLLKTWWALWVMSHFLTIIGSLLDAPSGGSDVRLADSIELLASLAMLGAAVMLTHIVREITNAHAAGIGVAHVFE